MASTRLIKRRIKSAKNISQITKAMEMVSASKMKKSQNLAVSGKPYAQKIREAVFELAKRSGIKLHPLLQKNIESKKKLVVVVSTNKGLCGGLNTNLFRMLIKSFPDKENTDYLVLGKKGESFIVKSNRNLLASFGQNGMFMDSVGAVIQLIIDSYLEKKYQEVYLSYNNFISALKQIPEKKMLLPLDVTYDLEITEPENSKFSEFVVEPGYRVLFESLLPHFLENQVRAAILEAEASEHSARMIAMKNATDSAIELMNELTLEYNKARQEKITFEIADMVTARMAV